MAKEDKTYKIFINGNEKTVTDEVLSFEQLIELAFGSVEENVIYSISFEKAREPKEGELLPGASVTIKNNAQFDVDDTGRS